MLRPVIILRFPRLVLTMPMATLLRRCRRRRRRRRLPLTNGSFPPWPRFSSIQRLLLGGSPRDSYHCATAAAWEALYAALLRCLDTKEANNNSIVPPLRCSRVPRFDGLALYFCNIRSRMPRFRRMVQDPKRGGFMYYYYYDSLVFVALHCLACIVLANDSEKMSWPRPFCNKSSESVTHCSARF
jgi:hypothetical protein